MGVGDLYALGVFDVPANTAKTIYDHFIRILTF